MRKALFPGSFDPPSLGHLDIIQRAACLCDKLCIGVAENVTKTSLFSVEEKKNMLSTITKDLSNVEVVSFKGLVIDYAKLEGIQVLIRGLRTFVANESEFQMAAANRIMSGIETVFLMADQHLAVISSSLIKEIAYHGGSLSHFVPASLEEMIKFRLQSS